MTGLRDTELAPRSTPPGSLCAALDGANEAGFYTSPRECPCGGSHIDRETYWRHRSEAQDDAPNVHDDPSWSSESEARFA